MSDPLSSNGAEEKAVQDYGSLEEMVFETDRDHDNEVEKGIRLYTWQDAQYKYIKNRMGTKKSEVVLRSFSMGLRRIRERHKEDSDELSNLYNLLYEAVSMEVGNRRAKDEIYNELNDFEQPIEVDAGSSLTNSTKYPLRDSEMAELQNHYINDAFFGGWAWRVVSALGLKDSELLSNDTEDRLNSLTASIEESVDEAMKELERMAVDYLGTTFTYWSTEGLTQKQYDKWCEICEVLTGDEKEKCKSTLDAAEQFVEKSDNGDGEE